MGVTPSKPPAAEYDAAAVAARQRAFDFFESLDPGRPFRWVQHAFFLYRSGGVERARPVFRAALARVGAEYGYIYGAWVTLEEEQDGGADAAREVFAEWRARCAADGGGPAPAEFWRRYLWFELAHGGAARARAVAAEAEAAWPRDAQLRAECVMAEARLGDDDRARAAFDRALAYFAGDADAEARLTEEVRWEGDYLSQRLFGGCSWFCRGCWFRPQRWWEQL